ncbi:MAG: hypothetical protein ACRDNF_24665 [Streptosporangiaceae bacterium]
MCANASSLNRLLVRRTIVATQGTHPHFIFPAEVTVTGTAVPDAGRAFCAKARTLPASTGCPMPASSGHGCGAVTASPLQISSPCPVSILITYSLTFWAGAHRFPNVVADPGVCPQNQPWQALGDAMRLPHPGITTFTGGIGPGN